MENENRDLISIWLRKRGIKKPLAFCSHLWRIKEEFELNDEELLIAVAIFTRQPLLDEITIIVDLEPESRKG